MEGAVAGRLGQVWQTFQVGPADSGNSEPTRNVSHISPKNQSQKYRES